jgi:ABC-2 type transport system ATP-binding protein
VSEPGTTAEGAGPLVSLRGVTKWYGREAVLRGIDLDLPKGSVTALLGRNGAGKSTLLRIVLGLLERDGGTAEVLGRDPERLRPGDRARMAVVSDTTAASAFTFVEDELDMHRRIRGARWNATRAGELLTRFGVPLHKKIGTLSKGLQARLRLVLALSADPELLILDEPALGLDLFARQDLLETIIETIEREGRAVLIVSHLIDDVERIADRVVLLRAGLTPAQGSVDELRDRFRRARVTLGPGGHDALAAAAAGLLGVRKVVAERDGAEGERVVVFDDFQEPLLDALEASAGVKRVEVRRMSLREIYFEVLGGAEEEASVGRERASEVTS